MQICVWFGGEDYIVCSMITAMMLSVHSDPGKDPLKYYRQAERNSNLEFIQHISPISEKPVLDTPP